MEVSELKDASGGISFDKHRFQQAVSFSFDINDSCTDQFSEHSNQYTTFNGHELDAYEVFSGDGVHLLHNKIISSRNGNIRVLANAPYVHIVFVIQCPRHYQLAGSAKPSVLIGDLKHQAFYVNKGTSLHIQWEESTQIEYFELSLSLEYLKSLLPQQHFLYPRLCAAEATGESTLLYERGLPIWPQLKTLLYEMVYCKYDGLSKKMYIKSKVIELLSMQQSKHEKSEGKISVAPVLPQHERDKMMKVRDIVLENIDAPYSLHELAHLVGTNECYLKRNFKKVFGTTVYGYVHQVKMEKARKLLKNKDKRIAEIAHLVGYKHAAHFTAAFKRHFGFTPNKISALAYTVLDKEDWNHAISMVLFA